MSNFTHDLKTNGYDVIGINVSTQKYLTIILWNRGEQRLNYYSSAKRRDKYS